MIRNEGDIGTWASGIPPTSRAGAHGPSSASPHPGTAPAIFTHGANLQENSAGPFSSRVAILSTSTRNEAETSPRPYLPNLKNSRVPEHLSNCLGKPKKARKIAAHPTWQPQPKARVHSPLLSLPSLLSEPFLCPGQEQHESNSAKAILL